MNAERAPREIFDSERLSYRIASRVPGFKSLEAKVEEASHQGILTPEQANRIQHAFEFWAIDFVISNLGVPVVGTSIVAAWNNRDVRPVAWAVAFGALKYGSALAFEKWTGAEFSRGAKVIAFWPFLGGGLAMPYEICKTLGTSFSSFLIEQSRENFYRLGINSVYLSRGMPL